jgi:hypothetical protein
MVEMDVREHEVAEIVDGQAVGRQAGFQSLEARRGAAVDQGRLVAGQQVRGDDPRPAEVEEVEELEAAT